MPKILVIEDNPMHLEIVSELLEGAKYKLITTSNATDAIKFAKKEKPDLILMDLNLPEQDGFSLTRKIKNDSQLIDIPIIALSALVMESDKKKAFEAGCSGFISKPIDISSFVKTIDSYIQNKRSLLNIKDKDYNALPLNRHILDEIKNEEKKLKHKVHNVLIVDDNPMNAELLKEALDQIGQKSIVSYSGIKALELANKEKFDLILLDIMMPEMSGFEVIDHLKSNPKTSEIPVIFISALNEIHDIVKGLDLGSYGYITKPYNIEELKARILSAFRIKDLQDELRTEKKKLDQIFKFSADGIVMLNPEYDVISCSEQFLKFVGLDLKDVIGKKYCSVMNCDCGDIFDSLSEIKEYPIEKNGETIYLQINCSKILNFEGTIEGYVLVLRDISAYKEIENQKETFIATLTHDLKTPIRAEITALDLLLKGNFGELTGEQKNIVKETLYSSRFMFNMVDTLLSKYRYDNRKAELNRDIIDANKLIETCFNELKYLTNDKKQQVIFDFEQEKMNIYADPLEIKRVIVNIFSNAINYTQENGKIIIKTGIDDNMAKISFIDNGKGIPKEEISRIFNKYASYAKKFRQVGTGLGLYVAKQIIEAHDGTISVESKEGKGSIFTISLPLE